MELILAIIGPCLGGIISVGVWQSRRNSENVQSGLNNLHSCVHEMSLKVETLSIDVAKNYVTQEELENHEKREEEWHRENQDEVKEIKSDIKEIKEMQWSMRLDMLDIKDRK
jgi:hypothetical protein